MFSPSDAHIIEASSKMPVSLRNAPFRKFACMLHDLPRVVFTKMDGLAVKKLSEPRNHKNQRRWAACVSRSDDARKALETYTQSTHLDKQPLGSGCARAAISQMLNKEDAVAVLPLLERTGDDQSIVSYLKGKFTLAESPMGPKA
ncbi:Uncharacterised protein [Candidatus Anstonella stagnisolia]|nr:Uncharacterised protein [Candidatus Anstonella stagnisolia]